MLQVNPGDVNSAKIWWEFLRTWWQSNAPMDVVIDT
jgi:hypothetical protein